jgi:hypothetical protein
VTVTVSVARQIVYVAVESCVRLLVNSLIVVIVEVESDYIGIVDNIEAII